MDGERPVRNAVTASRELGELSDSALDAEIARALNVEPSPEFLARVRMRVASEPVPSPGRLRWMLLAGAAAAVVLAMVMTLWPVADRAEPQQAAQPDTAPPPVLQAAPEPPQPTLVERPGSAVPRAVPSGAQLARVEGTPAGVPGDTPQPELPPFPEVLISAEEVRAYRMLLGIADQERLPASPPPARAETGAVDLRDIDLASLRIEALPPMARLEGVRP